MDSFKEAWGIICEYCRQNLTEVAYKTWISKIEPVKLDFAEGKAILMVPAEFHRQTLTRGYMKLLNDAFASVFGEGIQICFTVPDEIVTREPEQTDISVDADYEFTFKLPAALTLPFSYPQTPVLAKLTFSTPSETRSTELIPKKLSSM